MNNQIEFWEKLLKWFELNKRSYPWRATNDVYHIVIAEILLQQTHVRKVEPVYYSILQRFPAFLDLSQGDESELESIIEPIGLTYRARRLKEIAKIVVNEYDGELPNNYNLLIKLPGVGDYIANAVLCYGYEKKTVPVDTNVIRLFTRYFALTSTASRPRTDKRLAQSIESLFLPDLNYRNANLAILDFAGLICTAHKPACSNCMLAPGCAHKKTLTEE